MQLLKQEPSSYCEDTVIQLLCDQRTNEFEVHRVFDGVIETRRRFDNPEAALSAFRQERIEAFA